MAAVPSAEVQVRGDRGESTALDVLTPVEARAALDRAAHRQLGMTGDEFLRR